MNLFAISGLNDLPFSIFLFYFGVFTALGLVIGSFVSALVTRLPKRQSMFTRSNCKECGHKLGVFDLLPILSWLIQRGCCRYCKRPVSRFYPAIELLSVVASWTVFLLWWGHDDLFFIMLSLPVCLALIVIDKKHMILPNSLVLSLFLIGVLRLCYGLYNNGFQANVSSDLVSYIGGVLLFAFAAYLFSAIGFWLFKKAALGMGDVKLFGVVGCWLGISYLPVFLICAGFLGVLSGGINIVQKKSGPLAFGPALIYSLWLILVFQRFYVS